MGAGKTGERVKQYICQLRQLLESLSQQKWVERISSLIRCADTIFVCGNGACCSISDHLACDLTKATGKRTLSLCAHTGMLTAYSNDFSYSQCFSYILDALSRQGDKEVLLAFSTSGESENVLHVVKEATALGIEVLPIFGSTMFLEHELPIDKRTRTQVLEDCFWILSHLIISELCKEKEGDQCPQ